MSYGRNDDWFWTLIEYKSGLGFKKMVKHYENDEIN
jgi:hypothetical protein